MDRIAHGERTDGTSAEAELRCVSLLQIEPTTRCNFTCGFCIGRRLDQNDISLETVRRALEIFPEIERMETHGEGEPLLHPDYFEMTRLARERGIRISTITNGSLFTAERIERILDSGIDTLFVSIESPDPGEFRDIRGGSLNKVVSGIRALLAARADRGQVHPTVGFSVTVLRRTQHLMPEIARLYTDLGMDGGISAHMLNTMPGYTWAYKEEMAGQVLSPMEQGLAWARYAKLIESPEYRRSTGAVHFSDEVFGQIDSRTEAAPARNRLARDYRSCPWLDRGLFVNRHATATGCARIKDGERFGFGDIHRDPRERILENREQLARRVRAGLPADPCEGCFVAEAIANRLSRLRGRKPAATAAGVTRAEWMAAMADPTIGFVPYDEDVIAMVLGHSDGTRTTEQIVSALAREWEVVEDAAAERIFPVLGELARLKAVKL